MILRYNTILVIYSSGRIQNLERGRVHLPEKVEEQKKKGHSNNGCSLPNVYTIKYYKDPYS